jgi:hypothetical protein
MKQVYTLCFYVIICLILYSGCKDHTTENMHKGAYETDEALANECGFENGMHTATVNYQNPDTGYEATYTLEVEVEDCEVTTIYFPKGGWLDDSHFTPAPLDDDGTATIIDDEGREFGIEIDE